MPHPDLLPLLALGPATAAELATRAGVSQPTISRGLRAIAAHVVVTGRARRTRYAARRAVDDVVSPVPVFEVRPPGEAPRLLGALHPVRPSGVWSDLGEGEFADDLPWFLDDIRPTGFLGRLEPRWHPDLNVPPDVTVWTADHVLRWATRYGWNLPGAFVIGEAAFEQFLRAAIDPPDRVPARERTRWYPDLAADVLARGAPGSSAAGEQPKFLATRDGPDGLVPVLVKFSPPGGEHAADRVADLLVAEHLALEALRQAGVEAARSTVVRGGGRVFLEVERFDRAGPGHRSGVVSLAALDGAFVGSRRARWSDTTGPLAAAGRIRPEDHRRTLWLEWFGRWTANDDQHGGNLSFRLNGVALAGLAPVYDCGPAAFGPVRGELVDRPFAPPTPTAEDLDLAATAWEAARAFWRRVAAHPDVTPAFRALAADCADRVDAVS